MRSTLRLGLPAALALALAASAALAQEIKRGDVTVTLSPGGGAKIALKGVTVVERVGFYYGAKDRKLCYYRFPFRAKGAPPPKVEKTKDADIVTFTIPQIKGFAGVDWEKGPFVRFTVTDKTVTVEADIPAKVTRKEAPGYGQITVDLAGAAFAGGECRFTCRGKPLVKKFGPEGDKSRSKPASRFTFVSPKGLQLTVASKPGSLMLFDRRSEKRPGALSLAVGSPPTIKRTLTFSLVE